MCTFVTKAEIERERTPSELSHWLEEKLKALAQTEEGKIAVRFRQGLCKQLVEEVYALDILCKHIYANRDDITLKCVIGDQNFDALVTDSSKVPSYTRRLEITDARFGEREYLQMIHLQEHGHAQYFGEIKKQGTKKSGITVTIHPEAQKHVDTLDQALDLIEAAIRKKLEKEYEKGTSLLVMTEDVACFRDDYDRNELTKMLRDRIAPINNLFDTIYVVGWSKETLVEWNVS